MIKEYTGTVCTYTSINPKLYSKKRNYVKPLHKKEELFLKEEFSLANRKEKINNLVEVERFNSPNQSKSFDLMTKLN